MCLVIKVLLCVFFKFLLKIMTKEFLKSFSLDTKIIILLHKKVLTNL